MNESSKMKYVFNPQNNQINPVTPQTHTYAILRNKQVSGELYALVCRGLVSVSDIAALFVAGKSPELLVKEHKAVAKSPQKTATPNKSELPSPPEAPLKQVDDITPSEDKTITTSGAFDGADLNTKKVPELRLIALQLECPELDDPEFAPTRNGLIKIIRKRASDAVKGVK